MFIWVECDVVLVCLGVEPVREVSFHAGQTDEFWEFRQFHGKKIETVHHVHVETILNGYGH